MFLFHFFSEECARTIICSWNGSTTSTSYSNIWNEISKGAKQYFLWISHWVYCVWNIYIDMFRILFLCVDRKLNVTWHTIFLCIRTVYTPVKLTLNAMSIVYYSSLNHDTKKNRLQKKSITSKIAWQRMFFIQRYNSCFVVFLRIINRTLCLYKIWCWKEIH